MERVNSVPPATLTLKDVSNALGASYEPPRAILREYVIDPAGYETEESFLSAVEAEIGRALEYDEWEDQRTKYAKEWS